VSDGTKPVKMYVDGTYHDQTPTALSNILDTNTLVGWDGGQSDRYFNGKISNLKIYTKAKNQEYIDKLYAEGSICIEDLQCEREFSDTLIDDSVIETRVNMSATGNKMIELKGDIYRES
jgi:hypothetical protein